jgi:superfamily I DNA/RNA helicase
VVLSTIHRLKGRERPVVFGIGLAEGTDVKGRPAGLLPHTYSMREPEQRGVLPTGGMGRIEDERDIAFVLISRAQEEVHLSGPATYHKCSFGPSRFIHELGLA